MVKKLKIFTVLTSFLYCQYLFSNIDYYYPYNVGPSASNYGNTGIYEIPNARFMDPASLRINFSSSFPYEFTSLTATPFSWFEASYRYIELKDQQYGPSSYSGNQSLKDKGFDIKIGLVNETEKFPAIALGLRDIAGTDRFSSEYLAITKRFGNFDLTTGIGWGILGSSDTIRNPFIDLDDSFLQRSYEQELGGNFGLESWFSGKASILGGLEYDFRRKGLRLKIEYDTSELYRRNKNIERPKTEFNVGFTYHPYDWLTLGAAFERGTEFRISFNLTGRFLKDSIPKPSPKNVVKLNKEQQEKTLEDRDLFYRSLNKSLREESIFLQAATYNEDKLEISVASRKYFSVTRPAGRSIRIASALSADSVEEITVRQMNGDLEVAKITVDRKEFDASDNDFGSHVELFQKSKIDSSSNEPLYETGDFIPRVNFPEFRWNMSPGLKHQIGGPEGFYLGQLYWRTDTTIKFARNLSLYTSFGLNLYDTFDFNNPSYSTIPHVRSDIQEYLSEGKNNIIRMQMEYMFSPLKDLFIRGDLGLLEEMFGGFGGQVLYRPIKKRYAFGISAHRVRQRAYDQRFKFRDYETTTGHLEFYAELPNKIHMQTYLGKYLAGDKGITLDLSRRYDSGFVVGVFATKTDLSSEEFGEGSFDKGFYFSIPTKLFYPDFRSGVISFGLHPLTKDGGAFLNQHNQLYGILGETNIHSLTRDWKDILN